MNYVMKPGPLTLEAWSTRRLPFEPKGWLLDLRRDIRLGLAQLQPSGSLYASYSSADSSLCDVENVLFYNVGLGPFDRLVEESIVFERTLARPFNESAPDLDHLSIYAVVPTESTWQRGSTLASWRSDLSARANSHPPFDATSVWLAMKECTELEVHQVESSIFGIDLEVSVPDGNRIHITTVIKGLLDGILSALHTYEGKELKEVCSRLALRTGQNPEIIAHWLTDSSSNVLGKRCVVWPRLKSVQWNPADDLCFHCYVRTRRSAGDWRVVGSLFSLTPG